DRVVAGPQHLVLADPEQQLAHHLGEEARPGVHQAPDDDREPRVDIRLLRRHEAEVLDPRQADVLDDEVELREVRRDVVDIRDVECVLVERPDRRALVHVDVLDPQLLALLQETLRLGVLERPATRALIPLGRVELDALKVVALGVVLELLQARFALARVPAAVGDQSVRVLLDQLRVLLERVEAVGVPLLQVGRLEDADVDVAVLEDVLDEVVLRVLLELLERPVRLRGPKAHVRVEAFDPTLRVLLLAAHPVRRARVPEVEMTVDDEKVVTVVAIHRGPSSAVGVDGDLRSSTPRNGAAHTARRCDVLESGGGMIERPGLSGCSSSGRNRSKFILSDPLSRRHLGVRLGRAAGTTPPRGQLSCYGVSGCVPQFPLNSLMSGVCVTWNNPLPSAFTVYRSRWSSSAFRPNTIFFPSGDQIGSKQPIAGGSLDRPPQGPATAGCRRP